ncbi:MAG: FmdB family zinc ribbon protein [bacterium]
MPTYNYKCRNCKNTFSIKASIKEKSKGLKAICPECEGKDIFQTFNSIGIMGGSKRKSSGSGSSCSSSSCKSCNGC